MASNEDVFYDVTVHGLSQDKLTQLRSLLTENNWDNESVGGLTFYNGGRISNIFPKEHAYIFWFTNDCYHCASTVLLQFH